MRGLTLLEVVVALGLAVGVVLITGTVLQMVLGTAQMTREALASTPEAAVRDLLADLTSCGRAPVLQQTSDGLRWWRGDVCVRVYVIDVRAGARPGTYVLRMRTAADVEALGSLRPFGESPGWVEVETAGGCRCRVVWGGTADPAETVVDGCRGCTPTAGRAAARPAAPQVAAFRWQVVVVPVGVRLPAEAPVWVLPQGMSLVFFTQPRVGGPLPPVRDGGGGDSDIFPAGVDWLPLYVHMPSPEMDVGVTLTAWGLRHLVAGDFGGADLLTSDLDGDGDGEVEAGEAPARRLVPVSAVEGWALWTLGTGTMRRTVPGRCGPLPIPVGDKRSCREDVFLPF